ncbi:MAG: SPOR domain-containing protein [Hyphomicrobiales bacterium]|nr:SPOR domain-containing protein [Hyphomicrobiales bacterium]
MTVRRLVLVLSFLVAGLAIGGATAIAQAPQAADGEALLVAGANSLSTGKHRVATRQLTQAMRAGNLSTAQIAKALYLRGVAERNSDRPAHAVSDLTSALWLQGLSKGDLAQAYLNRALAYEAVGMKDRARADQARAREIDPKAKAVASAGGAAKPDPAISSFDTKVETAEQQSPRRRLPGFRTRVARATVRDAEPVPSEPAPSVPATSFQTDVRPAPKPVPAFRTSILPEKEPTNPPSQPAPRPPQRQNAAPQWDTSVAADQAKPADAVPEEGSRRGVRDRISGLWRSARGKDDDKKEVAQETAPPPAATQWNQTTQVARRDTAAVGSPPAPVASGSGSGYRIQLAAVRSEAEAQSTWKRLAAKHGPLLAGREPLIEKTDLGGLGIFYRIQIGPFGDKKQSAQLCNTLKRGGVDCFLVAR